MMSWSLGEMYVYWQLMSQWKLLLWSNRSQLVLPLEAICKAFLMWQMKGMNLHYYSVPNHIKISTTKYFGRWNCLVSHARELFDFPIWLVFNNPKFIRNSCKCPAVSEIAEILPLQLSNRVICCPSFEVI